MISSHFTSMILNKAKRVWEIAWHLNLLSITVKTYVFFISVVCFAAIFVSTIILFINNEIQLQLRLILWLCVVFIVLVTYAQLRFLPDLIRIFISIEAHSRKSRYESYSLRYWFIRSGYKFFRIISIVIPLSVVYLALTKGHGFVPYESILKAVIGPDYMDYVRGRNFTPLTVYQHQILSLFRWANPVVDNALGVYLVVGIGHHFGKLIVRCFSNPNIFHLVMIIASILCSIVIVMIFPAYNAAFVLQLLISIPIVGLRLFPHLHSRNGLLKHSAYIFCFLQILLTLYVFIRTSPYNELCYIVLGWVRLSELSPLLDLVGVFIVISLGLRLYSKYSYRIVRIGIVLVLCAVTLGSIQSVSSGFKFLNDIFMLLGGGKFVRELLNMDNNCGILLLLLAVLLLGCIFRIVSDGIMVLAKIERNFRVSSAPKKKSLHLLVFNILKNIAWVTLTLITFVILVNLQRTHDSVGFEIRSDVNLRYSYVINILLSFIIIFPIAFLLGLMGNLVSLTFDLERYTNKGNKRPPLKFFALHHFINSVYYYAFIDSLLIFFISFCSGFAVSNTLRHTSFGEGLYTLSLHLDGGMALFISFVIFLVLTFFAALGRKLLQIEANLRVEQRENTPQGNFPGVYFFVATMKLYAILGALGIAVGASIVLFGAIKISKDASLWFFELGILYISIHFYILHAWIPDICHCLLKIESHVRNTRAELTSTVPHSSE